ncbi:MAG: hypothetical protein K2H18_02120, partial [Muribaculaceae bacterium]|nr:hypothetical protein [Muribaculaceae bacterium]
ATKAQIDTLAKLLTHNLNHDLDTHRKEIEDYLGSEIASRYYYDKGKIGYELNRDKGFDKAVSILNDKALYDKILAAPAKNLKNADKGKSAVKAGKGKSSTKKEVRNGIERGR